MPHRQLLTALLIGALLAPGVARADNTSPADRERAASAAERGERLYGLGRFDDALAQFQTAYEAVPAPELLFNIGQCHRHLGNLDQAIFSFEKYLYHLPEAANRVAVEGTLQDLERLRQQRDARRLAGTPPPASHERGRPFYTSWWFVAGTIAVAGAATAAFVVLPSNDLPQGDLGVFDFRK